MSTGDMEMLMLELNRNIKERAYFNRDRDQFAIAMYILESVANKGSISEPPKSWEEAEALFDEVISNGEAHE